MVGNAEVTRQEISQVDAVLLYDGLVSSETIFATYQNAGIRVFDISNEYRPEETAAFVPPTPNRLVDHRPNRPKVIQSCDVWVSKEGLVYSNDFNGGLFILEYRG